MKKKKWSDVTRNVKICIEICSGLLRILQTFFRKWYLSHIENNKSSQLLLIKKRGVSRELHFCLALVRKIIFRSSLEAYHTMKIIG